MADEIIMPYGAYKEKYIHDIPSGYLQWMAENLDDRPDLQEAADEEYQYRERYNCHIWD